MVVIRSFILVTLFASSFAFGWGKTGHEIVAHVGSQLAVDGNEFWKANAMNMVEMTTVPDIYWKKAATYNQERSNHWFQPDAYFSDPDQFDTFPKSFFDAVKLYGEKKVIANGTSIWRINQFYTMAVEAYQQGEYEQFMQLAGVMSHYIGDMSQPLHVTVNFDGKETHQDGIHKFFETDAIDRQDREALETNVSKMAAKLLRSKPFLKNLDLSLKEIAFSEVDRAFRFKDSVLTSDKEYGRKKDGIEAQIATATKRMADGAATLAIVLTKLWIDIGSPEKSPVISVNPPSFIPGEYTSIQNDSVDLDSIEDDCF